MALALLVAAAAFVLGAAAIARLPWVGRERWSWPAVVPVTAAVIAAGWAPGEPTGRPIWDLAGRVLLAAVVAGGVAVAPVPLGLAATLPPLISCALADTAPQPAAWLAGGAFGLSVACLTTGRRSQILRSLAGAMTAVALPRLAWPTDTGGTTLVAGASALVALVALLIWAPPSARRPIRWAAALGLVALLATGGAAGLSALSMKSDAEAAVRQARDGLDAASHGDRDAALARLAEAQSHFADLHERLDSPMVRSASWIPIAAQHLAAARDLAADGLNLSTAAVEALETADPSDIKTGPGRINLDLVRSLQQPFRQLVTSLDTTRARLDRHDSVWLDHRLTDKIDELRERIDEVSPSARNSAELVAHAPDLLGGSSPRRYFLAVLTPSEMRGTMGLLGNYGEIVADQGQVTLVKQGRNTDLNQFGDPQTRRLTGPPEYLEHYARLTPHLIWQEATASPHFPDVAAVMAGLYPQSGGSPVDGVIAIDPIALAGLLDITGPVSVAGWPEPLTASNAAEVLLYQQYVVYGDDLDRRTAFLSEATNLIWQRLLVSDLDPGKLGGVLGPMVRDKHVMITTFDAAEAELFHALGADGAFPRNAGDTLAVTSFNRAGNKIDWFLHRTIDYQVNLDDKGALQGKVTVRPRNEAPARGLPAYIIGGPYSAPSAYGINQQWLTLHTPWDLIGTTVNGVATPTENSQEFGLRSHLVPLEIPPGGTTEVVFTVNGRIDPAQYALTVFRQTTVNPDQLHLDLTVPPRATVASAPDSGFQNGRLVRGLTMTGDVLVGDPARRP